MSGGIYSITNLANGKRYVGCTNNLNIRRAAHFSALRHNHHINKHLQDAWNKYGEQNFRFEILEEILDSQDFVHRLSEREIYYINFYDTLNIEKGYNNKEGGIEQMSGKWTNEQVEKERKYWSQRAGKPILQINLFTGDITRWRGFKEACKIGGYDKGGVHLCLRRHGAIYRKFFWVREEDYYDGIEQDYLLTSGVFKLRCIRYSFGQYDQHGNLLKLYNRFRDVLQDGFNEELVRRCCHRSRENGKNYSHLGYIWRFIELPYYYDEEESVV